MIVQIYEIQTPFEAEECIEAGVDHIGSVILSGDEWKTPDIREVVRLSEGVPVKNSIIPLFRDLDTVCRLMDYYRPDIIHFCDSLVDESGEMIEPEEYIRTQSEIKTRFPEMSIMRSIPIPSKGGDPDFPTLMVARNMEASSDLFLTDTWLGKEPVAGFIGITGKRCDSRIARDLVLESTIPVILAGGLSPGNVYEALMETCPAGADSCTRTNKMDRDGRPVRFRKDFEKVARFVEEVRKAGEEIPDPAEKLQEEIEALKERLLDREAALPAHSIRPHQIRRIEELEDSIAEKEGQLRRLQGIDAG